MPVVKIAGLLKMLPIFQCSDMADAIESMDTNEGGGRMTDLLYNIVFSSSV